MNIEYQLEPSSRNLLCISVLFFGTVMSLGCGGRVSVPSTVPVKGIVKYKGEPAEGIRVTFHNLNNTTANEFVPVGDTGPDGSFSLSTGAPQNGAPTGTYVVTFERPEIDPENPVETEIDGLQGKYSNKTDSKWTVTVVNGENPLQVFELD